MKTTFGWLKTHLDTKAPLEAIVDRLVMLGHDVEGVENRAAGLEPFSVALVISAERHPNADRLKVCLVDTGKAQVQVVCGAPNAHTGMKGVFAPAGTVIPRTGALLKETVIRGVASRGMLCSAYELGLGEDHEGIIELPEEAPVGALYASYAGLGDTVLDIKVTPNRADCLGVRGIARDLAASGLGRLKPLDATPVAGQFCSAIGIHIEDHSACPLFLGRHLRGVRNGPSPDWLRRRLEAIGLRPISTLVDITNFLTYDLDRPLHVFDAGRLRGDLTVRFARPGETLLALNGQEYALDAEITAIADEAGVQSLGGVIGGEATGCTEATTEVLIEAALFDAVRTAATGRRLNISSDARYRFERGLDPAFVRDGLEIATRLMLDLCGGEASEIITAGEVPDWRRRYVLRAERPRTLGGLDVPPGESAAILTALGFAVERLAGGDLAVEPPSWRGDVEGEADLVEEVVRIKGYDLVAPVPLDRETALSRSSLTLRQRRGELVRRTLAARGLVEAVTFSFISASEAELFGGARPELRRGATPIAAMRTRRCSSWVRSIATTSRRGRPWSRQECGRGRPSPGTGAKPRGTWISTTSRPRHSPHSPQWARRRTTSRSRPIRPLGIIPGGRACCGSGQRCSALSASFTRQSSRHSMRGRRSPASRCSSTKSPSRARVAPSRSFICRCFSRSSATSPLSSIASCRPRPCCAPPAVSTASSSRRSASSMSTRELASPKAKSRSPSPSCFNPRSAP